MFAGLVDRGSLYCRLFVLIMIANVLVVSVKHLWKPFLFSPSVLGSVVDSYIPDLVLQGVQDNNFRGSLSADLKFTLQVLSSDLISPSTVKYLMF